MRTRLQWTEERSSSFSHTQHVDKEWKAGLGTLSRVPLKIRRRIYDFLMLDNCSDHKHRTLNELRFIRQRSLLIDEDTSYHYHYWRWTSEELEQL